MKIEIADLRRALRFEYLMFTLALPILGAASVTPSPTLLQIASLVTVAFFFHAHSALVNDLIDLPLDRTHPARARYPMVRGSLNSRHALYLALAAFVLALGGPAVQGAPAQAFAILVAAFILMTAYNVWGKKLSVPLLTDMVLSVSFGALMFYGAASVGRVGPLAWALCAFVILFMMLANAFGGLRDLANDLDHGATTTAIFFGARPIDGGLHIPRVLICYVVLLIVGFYVALMYTLLAGFLGYLPLTSGILFAAITVSATASLAALAAMFHVASRDTRIMMTHIHFVLSMTAGIALVLIAPCLSPWLAAGTILLFLCSFACWHPTCLYGYWRERLR